MASLLKRGCVRRDFPRLWLFRLWQKSSVSADARLPRNAKNPKKSKIAKKTTECIMGKNAKIEKPLVTQGAQNGGKWGNRIALRGPRFSYQSKTDCYVR